MDGPKRGAICHLTHAVTPLCHLPHVNQPPLLALMTQSLPLVAPTTASLGTKHVDEEKKAMETGGRAMQLICIPVVVYLTSICVLSYAKRERKRNLQSILCHTFLCSCYIFVSAMPNQRRLQWFN